MKSLIIHLSDLHLSKGNKGQEIDVSKFLNCFSSSEKYSDCFLVFSGDCTSSGKKLEFNQFDALINKITEGIKNVLGIDITIVVVPGNHDNNLSDENASKFEDVASGYHAGQNKIESLFLSTMPSMKNAFSFCRKFKAEFFNKAISYLKVKGNKEIDFNFVLVNSAPFSWYEHVDKDFHFIPKNEREICGNPSRGRKTIELLVSHHRTDWFEDESKQCLDEYVEKVSSICLFGHDHRDQVLSITDGESNVVFSRGGRLNVADNLLVGSFNKLVIDNDSCLCNAFQYNFDRKNRSFICLKTSQYNLRFNECTAINDSYQNDIINPIITSSIRESDAFVFPTLRPNGNQSCISSIGDLFEFLSNNKKIILTGHTNSGKSTILHRIFDSFKPGSWRILIDCSTLSNSSFDKAIRNAFNEQYKYSESFYDDFNLSPAANKIILLDNFDKITNRERQLKFASYCKEKFEYIIMTSNDFDSKTFKQFVGELYDSDKTFCISGFSIKKRFELYNKLCKIKKVDNESDTQSIASCVEASIKTCNVIDMSDPYYLCVLTDNIISRGLYLERNTSDAFNVVFKYSIDKSIVEAASETRLSNINSILQQLAFDITFKKHSVYFSASDLDKALEERQSTFQNIKVTFDETLDILKKSKIIKATGINYRFQRNSYIAYFASQEVVRLYQKGEKQYMNEAVEKIVHGINGDVFLFAAYQLKQVDLFCKIQDFLDDILKGFEEIDFKEKNNALLVKNKILIPETKEQKESKKDFYDRIDKNEQNRIASSEKDEESVYDKNYDKESEAIFRALKMIEISCKAISGFEIEIEADDRALLIDKTICSALKLANLIFSFSEEDIELIRNSFEDWKEKTINELKNNKSNENKIRKIKEMDIVHALYDFLITWILNLEHNMAVIMSSGTSIQFISKMDDNSFCKKIFKLMAFSVTQKVDSFLSLLEKIYDNKNKELSYILDRIVRVFVILNNLSFKDKSKLTSITGLSNKAILFYSENKNSK